MDYSRKYVNMCYEVVPHLGDNRPLRVDDVVFLQNGDGLMQGGHVYMISEIDNGSYTLNCIEFNHRNTHPIVYEPADDIFRVYQSLDRDQEKHYLLGLVSAELDKTYDEVHNLLGEAFSGNLSRDQSYEEFLLRFVMKNYCDMVYIDSYGKWVHA